MALEAVSSGSRHLPDLLVWRVTGAMRSAFRPDGAEGEVDRFSQLDPIGFLGTPGLWLGLAFAALCVALAVRLRRRREPD